MSSFNSVAKKVEQGVRDLEWLSVLASKLKEIGSIEQAENEVRGRYEKSAAQLDKLSAEVATAENALKEAEARKFRAEEVANEKLKEMKEMVDDTYEKAKKESQKIIGAAASEVQTIKSDMALEKQSLNSVIERERLKLSRVKSDIEEATATLEIIEGKISVAKERAMKAYQETFRTEIK